MGRASHFFCLLFFISIPTFIILSSHLMDLKSMPKDSSSNIGLRFLGNVRGGQIEKDSGKHSVGGDTIILMLENIRVLLGLTSSIMETPTKIDKLRRLGFSSAPSPAPALAPSLPTHIRTYSQSSLHHSHSHGPPAKHLKQGRSDEAQVRVGRIITVVVASIGAILFISGVTTILVCHKSRRNRKRRTQRTTPVPGRRSKVAITSSATSKVSSDHGLELFYMNSSTQFQESEHTLKQNSQSRNVMPSESTLSSPILSVKSRKIESDSVSLLAEDIHSVESVPSDDESFYSACHSQSSSIGVLSVVSEANLSNSLTNHSPFNSSNGSNSPYYRVSRFSLAKSPMGSQDFTHSFPLSLPKPPRPSNQTLEKEITQFLTSSTYRERGFQGSSESSHPCIVPKHTMPTSHQSKALNANNISKPARLPSVPLLCNGSIPRPPPPPPPLPPTTHAPTKKGINISHPPPLPPPCQFQQSTPIGKDGTPLPKLKPLHWDKVRAPPDRSMVWDKIRSNSFEFDEEMIESLFGYNIQSSAKAEELKSKSSSSKHVLLPKRLQNFTILLKALNATSKQACDALVQGNGLSIRQLEGLAKMVPTKEEEEELSKYEGDVDQLDSVEIFLKTILKIPCSFSRIEAMLYRETFEDEVVHLRKSFETLEEACKELRSSRLFLRLLEAVLKTGNRMNVGTIRGDARAFKLDALLKLADVKGIDGKTTLLHFVVQEIVRSEGRYAAETFMEKTKHTSNPKTSEETEEIYRTMGLNLISELDNELSNVKKTASIDLEVLATSVSNISDGMHKFKCLVEEDLSRDEGSQKFVHSMKSFIDHAEKTIKELEDGEIEVLRHVREITEYYHGDLSKEEGNPLRIFIIIRDFLCMLGRVCKELRSMKNHQSAYSGALFH